MCYDVGKDMKHTTVTLQPISFNLLWCTFMHLN